MAVLGKIRRRDGVAGQFSYSVQVSCPEDGDPTPREVTFVGNTFGGPIVMITPGFPGGMFVRDPERFGALSPEWVRRFFDCKN